MVKPVTVCICGGGNGAHVMAGLAAAHPGTESRVLTLFQDEAARWTKLLEDGDFLVNVKNPDGSFEEIKGKPSLVTNDASKAIPGADLIIFVVPAFAHQQYFEVIAPHVETNTAIIGLPGQPGFELHCLDVLKDKGTQVAILSYESLPWAARIAEFGRKVDRLGTKDDLIGSIMKGKSNLKFDPVAILQSILGEFPKLKMANSFLETYLMSKAYSHPPILYSKYKDWDGKPLTEKPLFYQGLSEFGAACLTDVSKEIVATARAISAKYPDVKMDNVEEDEVWYMRTYKNTIKDSSSFLRAMITNTAYDGLVDPMKEVGPGQWVPDFQYRYLSEDVPFGLAVTKGIAELAGVPTPVTDRVLTWSQEKLGKQFLVGSELKGKDVKLTRAPQAYGYSTLEQLLALL